MPVIDTTPQLTLYRNGIANLNCEAAQHLAKAVAVSLAAPASPGSRWLLLPHYAAEAGALSLYADRGGQRFRAYGLATALFAALPDSQKKLQLELRPAAGAMFRLVVA
ncbi:MAG: hypothetical protein ACRYFR_04820 [Janthinobacterium lividum]